LAILFASHLADSRLRQARQTKARAPVRSLADGDCIDTPVDTADAFLTVDIHECRPRARRLHTLRGHLVLGDLDRLHASAEAHGSVSLGNTASHASGDTSNEVGCAKSLCDILRLRRDKEEDGTLGGSLNPGPRNETLVVCPAMLV